MARLFNDAGNQSLNVASAVITDYPCTFVGMVNIDDETQNGTIMSVSDASSTGGTGQFSVRISDGSEVTGGGDGNLISCAARVGGGNAAFKLATHATGLTAGTWYQFVAVFNTSTSRSIYLNGINGVTDLDSAVIATSDRTSIGMLGDNSESHYISGHLAELAVYDYALSAADAAFFGGSLCPLLFRPERLLMYVPLGGAASPETDRIGGLDFALSGPPTASAHPRVIYPTAQILQFPTVAAVGGGLPIPVAMNNYYRQRMQ
jgi:hypothetical protein